MLSPFIIDTRWLADMDNDQRGRIQDLRFEAQKLEGNPETLPPD